jgi:signal transduction histidine kinase
MTLNLSRFACHPSDTDEIRHEKLSALIVAGSCCIAGMFWSLMYVFVFGFGYTAFLPLVFIVVVGSALIISHLTKNHYYAIYSQIICIILITTLIQVSIGGIYDSGFVVIWAFLGPMSALMFFSVRQSILWFLFYLINVIVLVSLNDYLIIHGQEVSESTKLVFSLMNVSVASAVVFTFASYFVNAAIREQKKARELVESNLQQEIVLRQSEQLATLGKLSAGIAHELNNPAAAVVRGADQLKNNLQQLELAEFTLGQSTPSESKVETMSIVQQKSNTQSLNPVYLDPLARSDREAELEDCLNALGVDNAEMHAPIMVNTGLNCSDLKSLSNQFNNEFPNVIDVLCTRQAADNLLYEISHGANRISEIVKALKSYTYMDQAPIQSVSIHEGLENTLVMLRSKLKEGIEVTQEYAPDMPEIEAYGSELNQVWTNIIDNAVSAMNGEGELLIRTSYDDSIVVVEICDSGPGIPDEIHSKIFDPFFTTKAPGEGTGLGLNISYNIIVQKHQGKLSVTSEPGETRFRIQLPLHIRRNQD